MLRRLGCVLGLALLAAFGTGGVARAGTSTYTVSFTGNGPSPAALRIHDGDRIEFRNDVDPNAGVPVLGPAAGAVSSVSVTVSGATTGSFTLQRGKSAIVGPYHSGSSDLVARYSSTYTSTLVLGALSGPSTGTGGTVTVAARSVATSTDPGSTAAGPGAPRTDPRAGGSSSDAPGSADRPTGPAAPPASSANVPNADPDQTGASAPSIHFTPQAPNVAAQVVPRGDGGTFHRGAARSTASGESHRAGGDGPTGTAAAVPVPTDPASPSIEPAAASGEGPGLPFSVDWTAVGALVLLCGVLGVLVRTLVVHRLARR